MRTSCGPPPQVINAMTGSRYPRPSAEVDVPAKAVGSRSSSGNRSVVNANAYSSARIMERCCRPQSTNVAIPARLVCVMA